jgi:DNA (cytosine-5)-methyltransferase 1
VEAMKYGSLFTGIGGFDLGFSRCGMECAWQAENDRYAAQLLQRRFPGVINHGDVRNVAKNTAAPVDLVCGGFPCQDVSVAGNRKGLAGERSGLWSEFHRIVAEMRPEWVVVENVPGLLSSNKGRDFATILQVLVECGYGVAWRILDAQYFGVPQRRRRVFIVGHLGDGRAAEVLFERESLSGDFAPSREKGAGNTGSAANCISSNPANRLSAEDNYVVETLTASYANASGNGMGNMKNGMIAWNWQSGRDVRYSFGAKPMLHSGQVPAVCVRRLTPVECERLQGFPDGWTDGQSDSQRYKQLGNAVCVPVIEWIGKRILVLG